MKKILIIVFVFISAFSINAQDQDILRAMKDEISRSMDKLQLESLGKPYYIEYMLRVRNDYGVSGYLGSVTAEDENKLATLSVDVRVGDYQFDNSNFFDVGLNFFGSSDDEERFQQRTIPVELDYTTLRRELWLSTDAAYKQAAEIYAKKQASLKNLMRKDTTHDFLQIEIPSENNIQKYYEFDFNYFKDLIKSVSSVFGNYPEIQVSSVGVEYQPETIYYANSEGVEYVKTKFYTGFEIVAATQADDGMNLSDIFTAYSKNPKDLPSKDSLIKAAKLVAENIAAQVKSDYVSETYVGPIIFSGQAAGQIFAQVFAPNLVTQRQPLSEGGMSSNERSMAFQRKIGGRVLPEFLSVEAKPEATSYLNTPLIGNYKYDDEGVQAQSVQLIKDGYLKNLLSSRVPTRRVRESNGHKRGGAPMYSNLFISNSEVDKTLDDIEMKAKIIELCKARELPYGIIIKKIIDQNVLFTTLFRTTYGNFRFPRGEGKFMIAEAYKIYPDGKEEPIRGLEGAGFTVQSFKDIIFTGKNEYVMNILAPSVTSPFISGGDQYVSASIITPDIMFEDGELQMFDDEFKKPPFLANPIGTK